MKLTNNNFYWDYNATSPLANSVKNWLAKGDVPFGNPSSIHSLGIKSKQQILHVKDFLLSEFGLSRSHDVFFHSGASEGVNAVLNSEVLDHKNTSFHYFKSDHSTSFELGRHFNANGIPCYAYELDKSASFPLDAVLKNLKNSGRHVLNFTLVNSESGVHWPLGIIDQLKDACSNLIVHVDAVQAPGKLIDFKKLNEKVEWYTFSGHKFGALKGSGFTFYKKNLALNPLIRGGGQQNGFRSGTENVPGILSLKLALEELATFDLTNVLQARDYFEEQLKSRYEKRIHIVGEHANSRNISTSLVLIPEVSLGAFLTALDMAEIYVSSGSACSSGSLRPSRVLLAMGYTEKEAGQAIRFSFGPNLNREQIVAGLSVLSPVIDRFLQQSTT